VLCDLDGTLVDSTASVMRNWRRIAAMLGRDEDDPVGDLHGIPGNQVLRRIAPDLDEERVSELNEALVEGEIADTGDVTATKGALMLIETVPPDRWAIVTSGTRRLAVARLRAAGLPVPPIMVTADDVHEGKPNPARPFCSPPATSASPPSDASPSRTPRRGSRPHARRAVPRSVCSPRSPRWRGTPSTSCPTWRSR
jgi:phosphoglycolate phosphatase-like HAD superfamily hydrolase